MKSLRFAAKHGLWDQLLPKIGYPLDPTNGRKSKAGDLYQIPWRQLNTPYWTPFAGSEFEDNMKLTLVSVVVYGVPGDGQVVAVIVRVESCENRPANREENGLTQIAR